MFCEKPTENLWVYRMDMPEGYKHFSKTKPIEDTYMEEVKIWWQNRTELVDGENEKSSLL